MQDNFNNKNRGKLLDFIVSSFPGSGITSETTSKEIFNILGSDKKIFIKIIPLLVVAWLIIFVLQASVYLVFGPSTCSGHGGPYIPSFFCEGDKAPVLDAFARFVSTTFWFIVVVEILLLFFLVAGKFAGTRYNITIPKPIAALFWLLVLTVFLVFIGLMIFG